jgi:group I intron endonuclease
MIGIYLIKNTVSGKMYIGQSVEIERRIQNHKSSLLRGVHDNEHLQRAHEKYGKESLVYSVLRECSVDELDYFERYYINYFNSVKAGYNLESGGHALKTHSEETKQRMAQSSIGKNKGNTPWSKGLKLTPEHRQRISEGKTGKKRGTVWNKGKVLSDEYRRMCSERQKGKCPSEETRRKMSESQKNRHARKRQIGAGTQVKQLAERLSK